jgi:UMF1 family MFS transporter
VLGKTDRTWRRVLSWAFYDWANSAFATVVMAGFFPIFFKKFWAVDLTTTDSTFWLGLVNSVASLLIVVSAPLLGAIADQAGAKKRLLIGFTALGVVSCGALFWLAQGQWGMALAIYLLGLLGFSGSNIFYDALLVDVAPPGSYERVSALGFALGYLGGGSLFAFNLAMALYPHWVGLSDSTQAVQVSFLSVALWWTLFAIPIVLWGPESKGRDMPPRWATAIRGGLRQLAETRGHIRQLRMTFLFLVAYWFYIDGVDTVIRMAVDFGLAIGFEANSLMVALLITQFVGFPAALVFGRLAERWGAKRSILLAIGIYMLVILGASRMHRVQEFYLLAVAIGLVQGGIQALSRALYASLIPAGRTAEFFGFYNMIGKFAAVLGPLLVGLAAALTGDSRLSLFPILLLFLTGALLLWRVDLQEGREAARRWASP